MKAFRNITVSLTMLLFSLAAFANETTPIKNVKIQSVAVNKFILFADANTEEISVKIKDLEGTVLFEDNLNKGYTYKKTYDMSNVPLAPYYIKVTDSKTIKLFYVNGLTIKLIDELDLEEFKKQKQVVAVLTDR
ncbi:MAG: hypothetical protein ACPHXR_09460 [Flavicella sp.]